MIVNGQIRLPGPVQSVGFNGGGDLKPQHELSVPTDRYRAPRVKGVSVQET